MTALLTGLGLAAAAGFNAWVVLLLFHGLARLLPQEFPGPLAAFLSGQTVFVIALILFLAEFVIDKIPLVDRLWDFAQTLVRPVVGALLAIASVPSGTAAGTVALGLGASIVALGTHVSKSTTRLTSTAAVRGRTQFALSLAEDLVAVALATLVFFVPWLTALFLAGLFVLTLTHRSRIRGALAVLFFRLQHPRRRQEGA